MPKQPSCHGLGVSRDPRPNGNNFKARLAVNGSTLNLGRFATAHEARLAYDQAVLQLRGADAATNYPAGTFELGCQEVSRKVSAFLEQQQPRAGRASAATCANPTHDKSASAAGSQEKGASCCSPDSQQHAPAEDMQQLPLLPLLLPASPPADSHNAASSSSQGSLQQHWHAGSCSGLDSPFFGAESAAGAAGVTMAVVAQPAAAAAAAGGDFWEEHPLDELLLAHFQDLAAPVPGTGSSSLDPAAASSTPQAAGAWSAGQANNTNQHCGLLPLASSSSSIASASASRGVGAAAADGRLPVLAPPGSAGQPQQPQQLQAPAVHGRSSSVLARKAPASGSSMPHPWVLQQPAAPAAGSGAPWQALALPQLLGEALTQLSAHLAVAAPACADTLGACLLRWLLHYRQQQRLHLGARDAAAVHHAVTCSVHSLARLAACIHSMSGDAGGARCTSAALAALKASTAGLWALQLQLLLLEPTASTAVVRQLLMAWLAEQCQVPSGLGAGGAGDSYEHQQGQAAVEICCIAVRGISALLAA